MNFKNSVLPITRIDDGFDYSSLMPDPKNAADAQNLALTDAAIPDSAPSTTAPTHTAAAIASSKAFNLNDFTSQHYYNEVIRLDGLHDFLVIDNHASPYANTEQGPERELVELAPHESAEGRRVKPGQTIFAPKPEQITALYYRLIDQLSDRVSLNELNLANNVYGRVMDGSLGNSVIFSHQHTVVSGNDYYVPLYDSLYRTCINQDVLNIIRTSYQTRYQAPEDVTIQDSAGLTQGHKISSLRQARVFIHSHTWSLFSAGMNNLLASSRTLFFKSWSSRMLAELTHNEGDTALNTLDDANLEALDDFNLIKTKLNSLVEQLVIGRDTKLASHHRFKGLKNPRGCVAYLEAHQWVSPKSGYVYFESAHLVSTAQSLIFSGYLDAISWQIDGYKKHSTHKHADEWLSPGYVSSMIDTVSEIVDYVQDSPEIQSSFNQEVMDNHRHYYSPQSLVSLLDLATENKTKKID